MTPDSIRAAYRRALDEAGVTIGVRRYTGAGAARPWFQADVIARVVGHETKEVAGDLREGVRKVILLADDLIEAQFPMPLRKGDKVVIRGRELTIEAPDDDSRRVAGVLIAYELTVRG